MTPPLLHTLARLAIGVAIVCAPTLLGAQSVTRWYLSWKSDAYRYVDGAQVPVGTESRTLTVTAAGAGDSVMVIMPTANPAVIDSLAGTLSGARLAVRSRPRGDVIARPGSGGPPAAGVSVTTILELDIQANSATGTLTRLISGIPGATVPPVVYQVSGSRVP